MSSTILESEEEIKVEQITASVYLSKLEIFGKNSAIKGNKQKEESKQKQP